jgi:hypothetical protein
VLETVAILAAGFWAGTINVVVGSGTLVTFPTLLLLGYPPVVANVSNNIGLVGGGLTGSFGYRRELAGHGPLLRRLLPASLAGGVVGAVLLLVLPSAAFRTIVPVLIVVGLLMVVAGPAVQRRAVRRRGGEDVAMTPARTVALAGGIALLGVYGGYFGAAQGILVMGLMTVMTSTGLQSVVGIKNVLTTVVNAVAALTFVLVAWDRIDWHVVLLVAIGATLGGLVGARVGRRLPPTVLRALIVVIGTVAVVRLVAAG